MKLFNMKPQKCPVCDAVLNAASNPANDESPSPEDFTICIRCRSLLVFKEDLSLRTATEEEIIIANLESVTSLKADDFKQELDSKKYSVTSNEFRDFIL